MKLVILGLAIIAVPVAIGFTPITDAAWQQWRMVWALGAGGTIGIGLGLVLIGAIFASTRT